MIGGISIINKRIYISYSPGRSVEYCFWKYFFQISGIWVKDEVIKGHWKIDTAKTPHLVIFSRNDESNYGNLYPNIVYCVRKKSNKASYRRDIIKLEWWNGYYHEVLNQLFFEDVNLLRFLNEMMNIFAGQYRVGSKEKVSDGLWSSVWLFHEIAQAAMRDEWDKQISNNAAKAMILLEKKGKDSSVSWYYQYASLYCEYMRYGVNRNAVTRMRWSESLLEKCSGLAEKGGWSMALSLLAGRISLLTSTQNKYAVSYFKNILRYDDQAELLYEVGHIYEKAYGDKKMAWHYYQLAYQQDSYYYRAVYKIAVKLEMEGDWLYAMGAYSRVRKIIASMQEQVKNNISIRELEYEYKSCKNILQLCRQYMNDIEFQNGLRGQIIDMNENTERYINFDKLAKLMFLEKDRKQKKNEIMEELRKNLNTECCY